MELRDAVVMITGGAVRLGRSHALHLAAKGAHIALSYLPGEPWEATKAEIETHGVRCTAERELDVRNLAAVCGWVETTAGEFGHIDVLINNASPWMGRPFLELTEAEWGPEHRRNSESRLLLLAGCRPLHAGAGAAG